MDETLNPGAWIKQQRKALDLTQTALAERADCSVEMVQKIETGRARPSSQLIARLRNCLTLPEEADASEQERERNAFPAWLREIRKGRDWTQADLAAKLGCPASHVTNIERAKKRPSRELAEQLARILGLPKDAYPSFIAFARGAVALPPILPTPPTSNSPTLLAGLIRRPSAIPAAPTPAHNNLPVQLSPFVGRGREIAEVVELLKRSRLVTLTGPGGAGKTRLALAVGEQVQRDYQAGVAWVALANINDPSMVMPTIAAAFGIKEAGGMPIATVLANWLQDRELLLILDNLEQLTEAAPVLLDLLTNAPQLKMLITSRITLQIYGEQEYTVPLLILPAIGTTDVPTLATSEAVSLFAVRAREVRPDFELTAETAPIVAAICTRLDGLPLAIELAAARTKLLSPAMLLSRLNESPLLNLLVGGARTLPARQQTLRATIAWSYDLLDPLEQILFRRLAVFAGSWSLEAAEAVCEVPNLSILDGLESLLNKSLVLQLETNGALRFAMLATIREYANEQLINQEEESIACGAHLRYYCDLTQLAAPQLRGANQKRWYDRFEQEHANLRTALVWAERQDPLALVELVVVLWPFWQERGYWTEGVGWLRQVISRGPDISRQKHAYLMLGAGTLARLQGNPQQARDYLDRSLALYQAEGDQQGQSACLYELSDLARSAGDKETSLHLGVECLALARVVGDQLGIAKALLFCMDESEDEDKAEARYQEALALSQAQNYIPGIAMATYRLGGIPESRGDLEQATSLYLESLALFQDLGDQRRVATITEVLGEVAVAIGDLTQAQEYFEPALALYRAIGSQEGVLSVSYNLAKLARSFGEWQIMCEYAAQGVQIGRSIGSVSGIRDGLLLLGHAQLHLNQATAALATYREALTVFETRAAVNGPPPPSILSQLYLGLAFASAATGRFVEAAHLLGATTVCGALNDHDQEDYSEIVAMVQGELEPTLIETALATGSTWSLMDVRAALHT